MTLDIASQEALLYITAGLCTFLAIVVSYRWLVRQPVEGNKEEVEEEGKEMKETKEGEDHEEKEETAEEQENQVPLGCPFGFGPPPGAEESLENISDLLIDSSDIKPLNEEEQKRLEEDGASVGSEETAEMLDRRRVKELEDEVVKSMSEQQLEEERKARQAQLEAIFTLMEDNKERFGMASVDDVQNQYKLYV